MDYLTPEHLRGLTVFTCLGHVPDKRYKRVELSIILFSDRETYMTFEEQDYYAYHDCASDARIVNVCRDKERWLTYLNSKDYAPATEIA